MPNEKMIQILANDLNALKVQAKAYYLCPVSISGSAHWRVFDVTKFPFRYGSRNKYPFGEMQMWRTLSWIKRFIFYTEKNAREK